MFISTKFTKNLCRFYFLRPCNYMVQILVPNSKEYLVWVQSLISLWSNCCQSLKIILSPDFTHPWPVLCKCRLSWTFVCNVHGHYWKPNMISIEKQSECLKPRDPLTYFNDGEGGGGLSDFFGSEILAKSDFFVSMKDAGIFFGSQKTDRGIFWVVKKRLRDVLGYAKKAVIFLGRQILKLWSFWVKNMNLTWAVKYLCHITM